MKQCATDGFTLAECSNAGALLLGRQKEETSGTTPQHNRQGPGALR